MRVSAARLETPSSVPKSPTSLIFLGMHVRSAKVRSSCGDCPFPSSVEPRGPFFRFQKPVLFSIPCRFCLPRDALPWQRRSSTPTVARRRTRASRRLLRNRRRYRAGRAKSSIRRRARVDGGLFALCPVPPVRGRQKTGRSFGLSLQPRSASAAPDR